MADLRYFKSEEVECECGCGRVPDMKALELLDELRHRWGKPLDPSSGMRCEKRNAEIDGSPRSKHIQGIAFDIRFDTNHASEVARFTELAWELGFNAVEVCTKHIHIDYRGGKNLLWTGISK